MSASITAFHFFLTGTPRVFILPALVMVLSSISAQSTLAASDCNPEEVGYIAAFDVKAGSERAFEEAILNLVATVQRVESGVILYAPFKASDGKYFMMERYQDAPTREKHASSEEVKALFPSLGPSLVNPPVVTAVSAVCP